MRKLNKYEKKYLYSLEGLNIIDKILMRLFPRYTYKILGKGVKAAFFWNYVDNVNDLSTKTKIEKNIKK